VPLSIQAELCHILGMSDFSWPPENPQAVSALRRRLKTLRAYLWPSGKKILEAEAQNFRLNQLLQQAPQAYAVFSNMAHAIVAPQLLRWLHLNRIASMEDIRASLTPSDATALESLWLRLEREGQPFSLRAKTSDESRILGIQAEQRDAPNNEKLFVLWFTDLTAANSSIIAALNDKLALQDAIRAQSMRLDSIPLPLWLRDADGRLIWCNDAYAKMVEKPAEEVVTTQTELMGAKAGIGKSLAQRARSERTLLSEKHPLVIAGERRLIQISEASVDGQTLGMAQDMTVLDDMQSELRRFRASTQELLRALNTGIAIFNPKTQLTFYNDAFVSLFPLDDFFLDDKPTLAEIMEILREKRRLPEQADFKLYKKQWTDRFTSLIAPHEELMHLPDGTAIRMLVVPHPLGGLFMTFEDVTSRLELESSYNTLIAVQRETIDNLAEGLCVWRSDARLTLFNPAFAQLWDFKPKDLEANPHAARLIPELQKFFRNDEWDQVKELLQQATLSRQGMRGRFTLVDGREIDYATIPLPDGGMLNRFTDVSDTRKVERALREKNAALEQAERLKLDFLANVSYQLRTPLNAMMGFAEVLEKQYFGPMNERQMEYAAGMAQAGNKLIGLVNDILDLSTIEAGFLALNMKPIPIHAMVKSLYDLTHEWARKQNIHMTMECDTNIGSFEADERRIKQVMLNLVSNAIKFTPENGTIKLRVEKRNDMLAIEITDSGVGISKEDQDKIFSPFVQVQKNQRNTGAGLGLSLVRSIVELHHGTISLESDVGKGTKVTCLLPLKAAQKVPTDKPKAA
jgi:signal transduction histidine kinase